MLSKFKTLITHELFIPSLCLVLGSILILFAGPYVAIAGFTPLFSWKTRIAVCLVIVISFIFYQYIKHLKSLNKQDKLVNEITSNEDSSQVIDAESKALKEKFKTTFSALKDLKGGPKSLVDIPWYMIIGAPGSGKTTLLSNSGLHFPLAEKFDIKALQGVGGTKNCDWWITKEAVLLDTAGRYTSQDSYQQVDQSGWDNFLGLVKRYRKKPISGIIVSLSMTDLVTLNEYELNQQINQLRHRIAEVNDQFGARFPIYLVVTKSDLLAGFTQFFESFSHKEREQAFGITFDQEASLDGKVIQQFSNKFAELCHSVSRKQWQRISIERDSGKKSLLYLFGEQLSSLQPTLDKVVAQLCCADDGLKTGILRGLYFTSGTQSGAPLDRMVARMSQILGLKQTHKPRWNNDQRSYFIKDFIEQVMFAEADRFGNLFGYERKKNRLKQVLLSSFGIAIMGLCAGLLLSYQNNSKYLSVAEANVKQWLDTHDTSVKNTTNTDTIRSKLAALNSFSANVNGLADLQENHFSGLGLSQTRSIQGSLQAAYGRLLKTSLMPYVQQQLENMLADQSNLTIQYQALKSYLMLQDSTHRNDSYIKTFLLANLNKHQYFSNAEYAQISPHIESLIDSGIAITDVDSSLIANARAVLSAQPLDEIYYQQFKSQFLIDPTSYISMAQLAGSNWRTVFVISEDEIKTVEKFFTPEKFASVFAREVDIFVDKLSLEAWVLGPQNVIDKNSVSKDIEKLYVRDYINRWQLLLSEVSIKPPTDVSALTVHLRALTQTDSPIFVFLSSVANATNLVNEQLANNPQLAQRAPAALGKIATQYNETTPKYLVTSQFEKLHEAMKRERKQATEQGLITILQELNIALNFQLQNTQGQFEPMSLQTLQGFGYLQAAPLNRWIAELATNISNVHFQLQKRQLSTTWANQILPQCKGIVDSKYPFKVNSRTDANLYDFTQLFGKSSSLAVFFNTHIAPLVNQQTKPWQWKAGVQSKYQFTSDVLPFFERITTLQNSLFTATSEEPKLQFTLTPMYLDPRLARLDMSIYSSQISYQFGRSTPTLLSWPPQSASIRNEIRFIRRDDSEITSVEGGLFGLARFLQNSSVRRVSGSKVEATFNEGDYKMMFEVSTQSPTDPMLFNRLSDFSCLTTL